MKNPGFAKVYAFVIGTLALVFAPDAAVAYIGPGAGFAVISSFFIIFFVSVMAFFSLLLWPFRAVITKVKSWRLKKKYSFRRVVIVGLDGLDPGLSSEYISQGCMPNLEKLQKQGSFRRLQTTKPSISPVAWSSFATGTNPGKHRIFDFITRDARSYLPVLSSVRISNKPRHFRFGPLNLKSSKSRALFLRKGTSFWNILGKFGVFCHIQRVPISFPPEKHYGVSLSAMCTPDLRGTQGAFTSLMESKTDAGDDFSDGVVLPLVVEGDHFHGDIPGPTHPKTGKPITYRLNGLVDRDNDRVQIIVNDTNFELTPGEYSPWIQLDFTIGRFKKIKSIVRFLVTQVRPSLAIYITPINIDPENAAMPISHPRSYAVYLAKLHGQFATLGLAEDTWALNEDIIGEQAFLDQAYDIFDERRQHFFHALKTAKSGVVSTVIDTSDRIQHMFFRYLDPDHPANQGKDREEHKDAIRNLYQRMDEFVGQTMERLSPRDLLIVLSDHGFASFKWGVNLNTWLHRAGYLHLKDESLPAGKWFENVDWSRTRAYAMGLTGIFINLAGRESKGIVQSANERLKIQLEIKEGLEKLEGPEPDRRPIRKVMLSQMNLSGPYVEDAPDLIVGYEKGYRASWNCAVGRVTQEVIEPNTKRWSGDHSIDPDQVPGVFFSNWRMGDNGSLSIMDIGPTVLDLYGCRPPGNHGRRAH